MAYVFAGRHPDIAWGPTGRPQPSVFLTVYLTGTLTLAALYTDRTKGTSAPNPTQADPEGNYAVIADPGTYDVVLNGNAQTVTVQRDPLEPSNIIAVGTVTDASVAAANIDGLDNVPSMRRIGTGAQQSASGAALAAKAASGANSDITSLTGLSTPLSLPQGGTGATSASAARTALGLGTAAVANKVAAGSAGVLDATDATTTNNRTPLDGSVTTAKIAGGGLAPSAITGTAVIATDSRLSDTRVPTDATVTDAKVAVGAGIAQSKIAGLVGALGVKADLVAGVIPRAQLPNITSVSTVSVASQAAMLALAQPDADTSLQAVRTDVPGTTYWLNPGLSPSILSNWIANSDDAAGAASAAQAFAVQRSNHTGTQAPSTIVGTAVVTADSRLSDARTPLAHAASHAPAASDDLTSALSAVSAPVALAPTAATGSGTGFARQGHVHPSTGLVLTANNLSDVVAATARTNLGLGTAAVANKVAAGSAGVLDATDATTTNTRTPTDGTVTTAKIVGGGLSTSAIAGTAVVQARQIAAGTGLTGGGSLAADRTLAVDFGTGAGQAAPGATTVQNTRQVTVGSGLSGGGDLTADRSFAADFGTAAGKVTQGNDPRLSDARTPTTHATSHAPAGTDDLTTALSATVVPVALGTAALGAGTGFARQGHVHPTTGLALKRLFSTMRFVDPIYGNDANDGLEWGSALATVAAAVTALGTKGDIFLAPARHNIGTAASATTGLNLPQSIWLWGSGDLGYYAPDGVTVAGGSELYYLGTGIAVQTGVSSAGFFSGGQIANCAIRNGGSGTIGLDANNCQNNAKFEKLSIGSSGNASWCFSQSALRVGTTLSDGQSEPGFIRFRDCWFVGGSVPVDVTCGVTTVRFDDCGIDPLDDCTIGFRLNSGGTADTGFTLDLRLKMELHNGPAPPSFVLIADSTAGRLGAGQYQYSMTSVTAAGESGASPLTTQATANDAAHTSNTVTMPVVGGAVGQRVTSRKLYRTKVGGSTYFLVTTLADNTTSTFTDQTPDTSLVTAYVAPTAGTAGNPFAMQVNANAMIVGDVSLRAGAPASVALSYGAVATSPSWPRMHLAVSTLNYASTYKNTLVGNTAQGLVPIPVAAVGQSSVDRRFLDYQGEIYYRHLMGAGQGVSIASSGWGTGASVTLDTGSNDTRFGITAVAGTSPSANPTITITLTVNYPNNNRPFVALGRRDLNVADGTFAATTISVASIVLTFKGTPIAASTYAVDALLIG